MAQNECHDPRHFDRLIYSKTFTRDPLINRSLLCKNPRIVQGNIDPKPGMSHYIPCLIAE